MRNVNGRSPVALPLTVCTVLASIAFLIEMVHEIPCSATTALSPDAVTGRLYVLVLVAETLLHFCPTRLGSVGEQRAMNTLGAICIAIILRLARTTTLACSLWIRCRPGRWTWRPMRPSCAIMPNSTFRTMTWLIGTCLKPTWRA